MPIVATVVAPPPQAAAPADASARALGLARLNHREADYVRAMKRRERADVVRMLEDDTKRQRRALTAPLRIQVLQSRLPEPVRLQIFEELRGGASDKYVAWVRAALRLPLGVPHPRAPPAEGGGGGGAAAAVRAARAALDRAVAGHARAKREVLKLVCQAHAGAPGAAAYSLGLEGPPGTGKTHFVRHALAPALGRPMVSIPLGGASDISYLLGNMYTYEGSKEGRLAAALVEAGCCDPVVYFDEVDKISGTERGQEIASVLIHLVDPTANSALRDRFFHGIDLDFSRCTFVFSYNDPRAVPPVLLDRIKRVAMPAPSAEERVEIVARHMVPRAQARLNTGLALSDGAAAAVLAACGAAEGQGMRGAERALDHVLAAAQLCAECGEGGDGALAGAPGVAALDADGRVARAFAERCLAELAADGAAAPPPAGMYA